MRKRVYVILDKRGAVQLRVEFTSLRWDGMVAMEHWDVLRWMEDRARRFCWRVVDCGLVLEGHVR